MVYYRDVPAASAEPSTWAGWYSAWSPKQFTGKRFLKKDNLLVLPSQMHLRMCQKLWMCCSGTSCSALITYPISEEYLSSHSKLSFLALKWATVVSFYSQMGEEQQLKISMLPTSTSETKIALLHHQKEQSIKTVNEAGIVGSKEWSRTKKIRLFHAMESKTKSASSTFALKCKLTWKKVLSTRYSKGIGICTSDLVINLTCGTQGN